MPYRRSVRVRTLGGSPSIYDKAVADPFDFAFDGGNIGIVVANTYDKRPICRNDIALGAIDASRVAPNFGGYWKMLRILVEFCFHGIPIKVKR